MYNAAATKGHGCSSSSGSRWKKRPQSESGGGKRRPETVFFEAITARKGSAEVCEGNRFTHDVGGEDPADSRRGQKKADRHHLAKKNASAGFLLMRRGKRW